MEIIPVTVMGSIGYGNYWLKLNGLIQLRGISFHKAYGKWVHTPIRVTGIIPITVMGSHSSHRAYGNYSHNHYGKRLSFHKAYGKMGPYTTKVMV